MSHDLKALKRDASAFSGRHVRTSRSGRLTFFSLAWFCVYTRLSWHESVCVRACVCMECLRCLCVKTNLKPVSYCFHVAQRYAKCFFSGRGAGGDVVGHMVQSSCMWTCADSTKSIKHSVCFYGFLIKTLSNSKW